MFGVFFCLAEWTAFQKYISMCLATARRRYVLLVFGIQFARRQCNASPISKLRSAKLPGIPSTSLSSRSKHHSMIQSERRLLLPAIPIMILLLFTSLAAIVHLPFSTHRHQLIFDLYALGARAFRNIKIII